MRALLIQPPTATRDLVCEILRARRWEITAVPDGPSALDRLHAADYSLVVVDAELDDPGAAEVCREVRAAPSGQSAHVIVVLGREANGVEELIRAGASDILFRPVSPADLHARLAVAERTLDTASPSPSLPHLQELEETLGVQTAFFEELFESSPEAVAITDEYSRVLRVNREFTRIFGYAQGEALGRPIDDLVVPPGHEEEARTLTRLLARGERISQEAIRCRRDGSPLHVALTATPIRLRAGVVGSYAIYRDITEEKRASAALLESEERFRQLAENVEAVFWLKDSNTGQVLYVNPAFETVWGRPRQTFYDDERAWMRAIHPEDREKVERERPQMQSGEYEIEYRIIRGDGEVRWVRDRGFRIRRPDGDVYRVAGLVEDVTPRKLADEALRRRQHEFELLAESAPDVITRFDRQGRHVYVNRMVEREYGVPRDAFLGRTPAEFAHEHGLREPFARRWTEAVRRVLDTGRGEELEFGLPTPRGVQAYQARLVAAERTPEGDVSSVLAVVRNISELKRTEEALRRSEERNRALLDALPDLLFHLRRDGTFLSYHTAKDAPPPLSLERFLGRTVDEVLPPEIAREARAAIERAFEVGGTQLFEYDLPFGETTTSWEARVVVSGPETALMISRDITARRRAQEALRDSEERYRLMVEGSEQVFFYTHDLDGRFTYLSPSIREVLGYAVEELLGQPHDVLLTGDPSDDLVHRITRSTIETGERAHAYTALTRHRDGGLVQMEVVESAVIRDGVVVGMQGFARDVTERKAADEALRESEQRYRMLFDQSPVGVFLYDRQMRITNCNDRFVHILGSTYERLLGMDMADLHDPRILPSIRHALEGEPSSYEGLYETADARLWISMQLSPLRDGRGETIGGIGVVEDITERWEAEVELARVNEELRDRTRQVEEALRARSQLYVSMNHELRTPISAVMLYHELLLTGSMGPLSEEQADALTQAQTSAEHLLELVQDVLDLSKIEAGKMDVRPSEVSLPELLEDFLSTARPLAENHQTPLTVTSCADLPPLVTDPRRVRQILLNLLSNAVKFGCSRPIEIRCGHADDGVFVEVRDQGVGIPEPELERIFDDFVQVGESRDSGTGLGLAISRRLAELLGGRLEVHSEVDAGSTFRLTLPLHALAGTPEMQESGA